MAKKRRFDFTKKNKRSGKVENPVSGGRCDGTH